MSQASQATSVFVSYPVNVYAFLTDRGYSPAGAGEYRAVGYSPANKSAGALMRVNNKSALFTR